MFLACENAAGGVREACLRTCSGSLMLSLSWLQGIVAVSGRFGSLSSRIGEFQVFNDLLNLYCVGHAAARGATFGKTFSSRCCLLRNSVSAAWERKKVLTS